MSDEPWQGDACSLVDAFRPGERSPSEELAATCAAIERSDLNAFSHLHRQEAEAAAAAADVSMPFGGVPVGVQELDQVVGQHVSEDLLLDLALTVQRNRPWPLTTRAAAQQEAQP